MDFKIELEGHIAVLTALRKTGDVTPERVKGVMFQGGVIVAQDADVPVGETGDLKSTLKVGKRLSGANVKMGNKSVIYGPFIHYGVPKYGIAPRPVIYEALKRNHERILYMVEEEVDSILREARLI